MRKFTLVFATLLAMLSNAFGQKEGKILWENVVDSVVNDALIDALAKSKMTVSPLGNIMVNYNYLINAGDRKMRVIAYGQNGKKLWNITDFYKDPLPYFNAFDFYDKYSLVTSYNFTPRGNSSYQYDSTSYFDGNHNFLKKFDAQNRKSYLVNTRDGVIYYDSNAKKLLKYDTQGAEEWQFQYSESLYLANYLASHIYYYFTPNDNQPSFILLSDKGKIMGEIPSLSYLNLYPTNDKGFWIMDKNYGYAKFDSLGTQTSKINGFAGLSQYKTDFGYNLADNSLSIYTFNSDSFEIKKLTPDGGIVEVSVPLPFKVNYSNYFKFREIAPNVIMYSFAMPQREVEADIIYKIGVINFNDKSKSWNKDVNCGASNGMNGNAITLEAENTFFQAYSDPNQPNLKRFKTYDTNGNIKWESPFLVNSFDVLPLQWKIINDNVYFNAIPKDSVRYSISGATKIRFTDGKIHWRRKDTITNFNSGNEVVKNKDGEDVILLSNPSTIKSGFTIFNITTLNENGTNKWHTPIANTNNYLLVDKIIFKPTNDGKLIVYSIEDKNGKLQYVLRKISPCEELSATVTASATEVCPTEKIKLSTTKQEGVTYQWQKDGRDIPTFRDAVHDVGESGTYRVVVKDEFCQNTAVSNELKVTIRALPSAEIKGNQAAICVGEKSMLTATTNGTFFQWQKDERDINNATGSVYEASESGNYRVSVRDDKCPQRGYSNTYTISVKPLPEATISTDVKGVVYEPLSVKMFANAGTELSYQWLKNDTLIANATSSVYEAKKSGKYAVSVTKDGCAKLSDALQISILFPLANQSEINEEAVRVYPNPSRGAFNVILPKSLQNAEIQLFDLLGRERTLTHTGEQVRAEGLVQGTYFLRVMKGEKSITNKIVVE